MHKGAPTCSELGIPSHLHRNGRGIDPHFEPEEHYYRRFKRTVHNVPVVGEDGRISGSIVSTRNMSGNREKYCNSPDDVLYDINSADHFFAWGIWEVKISKVEGLRFNHPVEARAYTVRVVHEPEDCMYPHSIIRVLENGEPVPRIKSNMVKTKIREAIAHHTRVIKKPDQV